jgi:hypothetical protein
MYNYKKSRTERYYPDFFPLTCINSPILIFFAAVRYSKNCMPNRWCQIRTKTLIVLFQYIHSLHLFLLFYSCVLSCWSIHAERPVRGEVVGKHVTGTLFIIRLSISSRPYQSCQVAAVTATSFNCSRFQKLNDRESLWLSVKLAVKGF